MPIQRNFAGGEIGPTLYGGANLALYLSALATCRNFIIRRSGGASNRAGSQFVAEVKDSTTRTYLRKFVFNTSQAYLLEFGNLYIRFVAIGAQINVSGVSAWSNATNYTVGDLVVSGGVNYYCVQAHINHSPPNGTYWYALTGTTYEIPTPYAAADLSRLKITQSGDVITITHPSYPVYELSRFGDTRWTLTAISTAPAISAPTGLSAVAGASGSLVYNYVVTAVLAVTYEESVASGSSSCSCSAPTVDAPNALSWTAVANATEYNIYVDTAGNGTFAFCGVAASNSFNDTGLKTPDLSVTPPIGRTLFNASGDYPQCSAYYQQRQVFAGSNNNPEQVDASRVGKFKNFSVSSPIQDDDAVEFTIAGRYVSEVRAMIEVDKLIILTSTGEWIVMGDAVNGVLLPTAINLKQQSYNGASYVDPAIVGSVVIYNQARGGIIRDLRPNASTGLYDGRDLTVFAPHLFEGFSIDRMDFSQIPDSIVWFVRSDGTLLGLTYLPEFDVFGWHHHDTAGTYEDVCVIPETAPPVPGGTSRGKEEDVLYVIVNRTINGSTKRYIERFSSRRFDDYRLDAHFLDAFLTYNGINASATTVTLSTGTTFAAGQTITVTASTAIFSGADVGKGITFWKPGGDVVRITVATFTSTTVVSGTCTSSNGTTLDIPADLQNTALTTWSKAVNAVTGLSHLEGKAVSILANGIVLSGTVSSGSVSLGTDLYDVVHVGLSYTSDFETLDLDSQQQDIRDKKKLLNSFSLLVDHSRGIMAGPDSSHLLPFVASTGTLLGFDIFAGSGGSTLNALVEMNIQAKWDKPGRIFVRQTDPLPLSILAVIPNGPMGG